MLTGGDASSSNSKSASRRRAAVASASSSSAPTVAPSRIALPRTVPHLQSPAPAGTAKRARRPITRCSAEHYSRLLLCRAAASAHFTSSPHPCSCRNRIRSFAAFTLFLPACLITSCNGNSGTDLVLAIRRILKFLFCSL